MSRWSARRPSTAILSVVLLASACTTGSASGAPSGSPTATVATSPSTSGPSATAAPPASTAAPPASTASAAAQPSPSPAEPSSAEPPPASLAVEGGDPVDGQLGSFTWADGGSDSPWLPGAPLTVGSGERLTVSVAHGLGVDGWSASRVPSGTANGVGAVALGSGAAPVTFAAPDPGSWSVQVTLRFAGDLGSATYYWQVTVH